MKLQKTGVLLLAVSAAFALTLFGVRRSKAAGENLTPPKNLDIYTKENGDFTLAWKKVSNIENPKYELLVDNGYYFLSPVLQAETSKSEYKLTYGTLKPGKQYFWKVRTIKGKNESDWSEIDYFKPPERTKKPTPKVEIFLAAGIAALAVGLIWYKKSSSESYYEKYERTRRREIHSPSLKKRIKRKFELDYLARKGLCASIEISGGIVILVLATFPPVPTLRRVLGGLGLLLLLIGTWDAYRWIDLRKAVKEAEEKHQEE